MERPTNSINLPTTQKPHKVFSGSNQICREENGVVLKVNEMCVILWSGEKNEEVWDLGYCISIDDENYELAFEHLLRDEKESNLKWVYPHRVDVCKADSAQGFRCDLIGDWEVPKEIMKYTLSNYTNIQDQP